MNHLSQDQLYAYVLDDSPLSAEQRAHLESCPVCQAEAERISMLAGDLGIARASEPSAASLEAYRAVFDEYGPSQRGRLARAVAWISASLMADSRVQPLPAATRSARAGSYRLLYNSPNADIELFVEGEGRTRRLQGDVIAVESDESIAEETFDIGETLVQLEDSENPASVLETHTDQEGRFLFAAVPVGTYKLLITGPADESLQIDELSVT